MFVVWVVVVDDFDCFDSIALIWTSGTDQIQTERPTFDSGQVFVVRAALFNNNRNIRCGQKKSPGQKQNRKTQSDGNGNGNAGEDDVGCDHLAESDEVGPVANHVDGGLVGNSFVVLARYFCLCCQVRFCLKLSNVFGQNVLFCRLRIPCVSEVGLRFVKAPPASFPFRVPSLISSFLYNCLRCTGYLLTRTFCLVDESG